MIRRVLVLACIVVWYVTVRYQILWLITSNGIMPGYMGDFPFYWSWGMAFPVTALSILIPYVMIEYVRGKL